MGKKSLVLLNIGFAFSFLFINNFVKKPLLLGRFILQTIALKAANPPILLYQVRYNETISWTITLTTPSIKKYLQPLLISCKYVFSIKATAGRKVKKKKRARKIIRVLRGSLQALYTAIIGSRAIFHRLSSLEQSLEIKAVPAPRRRATLRTNTHTKPCSISDRDRGLTHRPMFTVRRSHRRAICYFRGCAAQPLER